MTDETNKVAVVTGASSGIGMATALQFAEQNYNVVLAARRIEELHKVARECEIFGVEVLTMALDTADDQAVHALGQAAIDSFDHIDVWVNNAGVYLTGKFEDLPVKDMRRLMDVNFFGYVHGSHTALAQFRRQGYGTLINVSSVNAAAPQPYITIYSASKAAIRAFDESLRMELRIDGLYGPISICTVMPAGIDTNLFQNAANYTGKKLQAIEPVYDPTYVARRILKLARFPRRQAIVGPMGLLMALQNAHSPRMYEKQIGKFTQKDLLSEEIVADSPGNLYEPILENQGIRGGWRESRVRADQLNIGVGIGLAALTGAIGISYYLLGRRRTSS